METPSDYKITKTQMRLDALKVREDAANAGRAVRRICVAANPAKRWTRPVMINQYGDEGIEDVPVALADVLVAVGATQETNTMKTVQIRLALDAGVGWAVLIRDDEGGSGSWDLRADDLDRQSDPTKIYLLSVLTPGA